MKNGILLVNKDKNMTSRDVINILSKKFKNSKMGHTGTLDPLATGLLIICVNKATSLVPLLVSDDKEYIAKVKLGVMTDTLDVTGKIILENDSFNFSKKELQDTLNSFLGSYMQEVPIYSAVKVNGKKLYEYARKNEKVILPKKKVFIKNIELIDYQKGYFVFKVLVSKGTYIRSLIRDIGQKMNVLMVMEELKRIRINDFDISMAKTIREIEEEDIIPVEEFLKFRHIDMDNILYKKVSNGVSLPNIYGENYVMFFYNQKLVAIYKNNEKNELSMYKLF